METFIQSDWLLYVTEGAFSPYFKAHLNTSVRVSIFWKSLQLKYAQWTYLPQPLLKLGHFIIHGTCEIILDTLLISTSGDLNFANKINSWWGHCCLYCRAVPSVWQRDLQDFLDDIFHDHLNVGFIINPSSSVLAEIKIGIYYGSEKGPI